MDGRAEFPLRSSSDARSPSRSVNATEATAGGGAGTVYTYVYQLHNEMHN